MSAIVIYFMLAGTFGWGSLEAVIAFIASRIRRYARVTDTTPRREENRPRDLVQRQSLSVG